MRIRTTYDLSHLAPLTRDCGIVERGNDVPSDSISALQSKSGTNEDFQLNGGLD